MIRRGRALIFLNPTATPAGLAPLLSELGPAEFEEIVGLFVEDVEVLSLGRLTVAREIRFDDATPRVPDAEGLERQLRIRARQIRAEFERRMAAMRARHSFRVTRGPLAAALREASAGFDVLLLSGGPGQLEYRGSLRPHITELLAGGPRLLIVARRAPRPQPRIAVLYDGSTQSAAALATAMEIARDQSLALCIWIDGEPGDAAERVLEARQVVGAVHARHMDASGPDAVAEAARQEAVRAIVLPRDGRASSEALVLDLLDRVDCSIIIAG